MGFGQWCTFPQVVDMYVLVIRSLGPCESIHSCVVSLSMNSGPCIDCRLEQDRKGRAAFSTRSGNGEGVAVLVFDVLEYRCSISWNSLFGCATSPVSPDPDLGIGNLSRCGTEGEELCLCSLVRSSIGMIGAGKGTNLC